MKTRNYIQKNLHKFNKASVVLPKKGKGAKYNRQKNKVDNHAESA